MYFKVETIFSSDFFENSQLFQATFSEIRNFFKRVLEDWAADRTLSKGCGLGCEYGAAYGTDGKRWRIGL